MAPVAMTKDNYMLTTVHPLHGWEFSCHMVRGQVSDVQVHSPGDPDQVNFVADYIFAIQQGLAHLLVITSFPDNLAQDLPGLREQVHLIRNLRPDLFSSYRVHAMLWVKEECRKEGPRLHQERYPSGEM